MFAVVEENKLPSIQSNLQQRHSITKFNIDSILKFTVEKSSKEQQLENEELNRLKSKEATVDPEDNNDKSFVTSPSYTSIIAKAILSSTENKLSLGSIYDYIAAKFPEFLKKGQGWRNCVRHNLSLSECFVKAGRAKNGRGNYWGIHPRYIQNFLKGDYRKRRASHRPRQRHCEYDMNLYQNFLFNRTLCSMKMRNGYQHTSCYPTLSMKQITTPYNCSCCISNKQFDTNVPIYRHDLRHTSYHFMPKHKYFQKNADVTWMHNKQLQ